MNNPVHVLGDFELIRELGRGGMGIVYEARQVSLNRKVALKVLKAGLGLTAQAVNRFGREAAAAAKLHHTNIVPIYATGEDGDYHFYAMELIEGSSLDRIIRAARMERDGNMETALPGSMKCAIECATKANNEASSTVADVRSGSSNGRETLPNPGETTTTLSSGPGYYDQVARMFAEVADGLEHAHRQGVIHRDIKPSNLLVSPQGRLHLTDFGLARVLEEPGMTVTGEFMGSPLYMSPEQIAVGRALLDHRTDIYSLGATLYEALTLQPPFQGERRDQILSQILHKEPKPPRSIDRKIPPDLETICLKAMDKDPDRRYRTAGALAEDLRRYVNRFAIQARRASLPRRAVKWVRRHPGLAFGTAVAVLSLLIALGAMLQVRSAAAGFRAAERQKSVEKAMLLAMSGEFTGAEKAIGQAEVLGASPGYTRLLRGQLAWHRGLDAEAVVHLKEATNQLPKSVAALAMLLHVQGDAVWGGPEAQTLESLKPETSLDYLMLGSVQAGMDPVRAAANLDKGVELGIGPMNRLLRAQALTWVAWSTGSLADARRAIDDAEFANSLLGSTNPVALAASLSARLVEARLLEGKDESARREVLARARAEAVAMDPFTAAKVVSDARRDYFDYIGDGSGYAAEVESAFRRFPVGPAVNRYALSLFAEGRSSEALKIVEQSVAQQGPRFQHWYVALIVADATGNLQQAIARHDKLPAEGFDALYRGAALLPLGLPEQAVKEIGQVRAPLSFFFHFRDGWYEHLFDFYIGRIDAHALLQYAGSSLLNQCEGHFALALMSLGQGRRAEAVSQFRESVRARVFGYEEYAVSRVLLKRLEADPHWPPWLKTNDVPEVGKP